MKANTKLTSLSEIISLRSVFAQIIVEMKPANNPAITPLRVVLDHHKLSTSTGPNEEPNPLQA